MNATDRLTAALVSLAAEGGRPPCGLFGGSELWLSDDPAERKAAAAWCSGCPVKQQCHDAAEANDERHGVWGGIDRTKPGRPGRPGRPRKEAA